MLDYRLSSLNRSPHPNHAENQNWVSCKSCPDETTAIHRGIESYIHCGTVSINSKAFRRHRGRNAQGILSAGGKGLLHGVPNDWEIDRAHLLIPLCVLDRRTLAVTSKVGYHRIGPRSGRTKQAMGVICREALTNSF